MKYSIMEIQQAVTDADEAGSRESSDPAESRAVIQPAGSLPITVIFSLFFGLK